MTRHISKVNIGYTIMKITITILLLIAFTGIKGQISSVPETVKNYNLAQKRLLVIGVFQSANCLTQNILDQDSIMAIACHVSHMPFLLPYKECFPEETNAPTSKFLNIGQINEAKRSVNLTSSHSRIQSLLEIFMWYLHQVGESSGDMDSASRFLQLAFTESNTAANSDWKIACLFQSAELNYQKGNLQQSRVLFYKVAKSGIKHGRKKMAALAYMRIGDLISQSNIARENVYNQSLRIFEALGLVEKQIELRWKIALCHLGRDFRLAENDLHQIIHLSAKIGFKHIFYAQNHLSYILNNNGDYVGALDYARAAMQNMKWSGLSVFQGTCDMRMGVAFASLGKIDESLKWFRMAINTGTRENHLFWYKSVPLLTRIIGFELNKPAIAISLIDSLTNLFPPATVWEKLQLLSCVGICNKLLKKPALADNYFKQVSALARANPQADPYGEMFGDYLVIAQFYIARNNLATARQFFKLAILRERKNNEDLYFKYLTAYKMDSLEENYKSALQNHIKYKTYYDSFANSIQMKRIQQLCSYYAGQTIAKNETLVSETDMLKQREIEKNKLAGDRMIIGASLVGIVIVGLFLNFRLKQRANLTLNKQHLEFRRLVDEKEWLLKEVRHRVNNNLRTVTSLLELQADYLDNDALEAVQKSQHRIYAILLVHQKLYQSHNLKMIDMSVFLPEFIRYLEDSFDTHTRIQFQIKLEAINLELSQGISVALIVNEAVTNSIKYAFPDKHNGIVEILIRREKDKIMLAIADNGIGIESSLINGGSESLGLKLIKGLSEDIDGVMEVTALNGTNILINFPADPPHHLI